MHLVVSCHKNGDKVRQVWATWIEAKRYFNCFSGLAKGLHLQLPYSVDVQIEHAELPQKVISQQGATELTTAHRKRERVQYLNYLRHPKGLQFNVKNNFPFCH